MKQVIGITVHYDDQTTLKVPASGLQIVVGMQGAPSQNNYLNADECPVHGPWRLVPAGISKRTNRPFKAFYACDQEQGEERCVNKPSRDWVETHPPDKGDNDASQFDPGPTAAPTDKAEDFDSLPF